MTCDHCANLRAQTAAWLAKQGLTDWIAWAKLPIDTAPRPPHLRYTGDVPIVDCRCDCHSFARIAGSLPRLEVVQ